MGVDEGNILYVIIVDSHGGCRTVHLYLQVTVSGVEIEIDL